MLNIGEPNPFKRRIISRVITAIILYVCSVGSKALSVRTTRRIPSSVYCLSVIRRVSGFRTVSDEAVLVLVKTISID